MQVGYLHPLRAYHALADLTRIRALLRGVAFADRLPQERRQATPLNLGVCGQIAREYLPLLASAFILALASRPGANHLLGFVALIPLFAAIQSARPWVAFRRGLAWGAFTAVLLSSLGSHTLSPLSLIALPPLVAGYAAAGAWLSRKIGFSPFVLGVAWIGVEFALSFLGMQLGLLPASQSDGWFMHHFGRALGYVAVGALVAYVNAACFHLVREILAHAGSGISTTSSADSAVVRPGIVGFLVLRGVPDWARPRAPPTG